MHTTFLPGSLFVYVHTASPNLIFSVSYQNPIFLIDPDPNLHGQNNQIKMDLVLLLSQMVTWSRNATSPAMYQKAREGSLCTSFQSKSHSLFGLNPIWKKENAFHMVSDCTDC